MPKRTDIHKILVIGSGPVVIGQACEFDYSGTQACRVLKAEGLRVILVNSNPATIMTDPEFADAMLTVRHKVPIIPLPVVWDKHLNYHVAGTPLPIPWDYIKTENKDRLLTSTASIVGASNVTVATATPGC